MNTSTDRYRTLLVAAAAADNTTPPERHVSFGTRRLTLLVAAAALSITAAAAAAPPAVQIEARIRTEGLDKHNRALPFTVYVLSQDVSWKLKSTEDLEGEHPLLSPELVAAVNRAREVFCVGTASYEGAARTEEERAARRAGELARWIGAIVQDAQKTRLFAVNAGQYRGPAEAQSADQRRAIIIATQEHADGVDLGDALYAGLKSIQEGHPIVYGLLHHYSKSNEWLKDSNILEQ